MLEPLGKGCRRLSPPALPRRHTGTLAILGAGDTLRHIVRFCYTGAGPGAMSYLGLQSKMRGALGSWQGRDIIHCYHGLSSNHRLSPVLWEMTVVRTARDKPGRHLTHRFVPAWEVSGGCELLPTPQCPSLQWGVAWPAELDPRV